jgi:ribonuclease BN (tRNA processing enzyme)
MKLTILGKHGPWPAAGSACSGYLLEAGGARLLLDCGCGVLGKLQEHCPIERLDAVILSHLHADHMGDMLVLRYALPQLIAKGLRKATPMPVYLPGSPEDMAGILLSDKSFASKTVKGGDIVDFNGIRLTFFAVRHPVPCNAVRIEHGGKSFIYSGDMNATEGFEEFARGADLLLIDGCFPEKEWNGSLPHLSAFLAAGMGKRAGARRTMLTHFRPIDDEAALLDEARRENPAIEAAQAGFTYAI